MKLTEKNFVLKFNFYKYILFIKINQYYSLWGLGIGDWGLGIGDWAQSPIPNPQTPISNPPSPNINNLYLNTFIYKN